MPTFTPPEFWHQLPPALTARALVPLAAIYGAITARRMQRKGTSLPCPVICIGNFTVGGTGKTPMVQLLARQLLAQGYHPFILSRGFGGAGQRWPVRVDPVNHGAAEVGDEPLLLAQTAPVIVCADRLAGGRLALSQGADVLLMDDGLQNPALAKSLSIAMVAGQTGFGNGLCLPAGPLRAPLPAQWPQAAALVIVGQGAAGDQAGLAAEGVGKPVFRARLVPDPVLARQLAGQKVLAFAGIGRPAKFFETLESVGANLVKSHSFADHHVYTAAEIRQLQDQAMACDALLVTTEKDLMRTGRWQGAVQPLALPVALVLEEPEALAQLVNAALGKRLL